MSIKVDRLLPRTQRLVQRYATGVLHIRVPNPSSGNPFEVTPQTYVSAAYPAMGFYELTGKQVIEEFGSVDHRYCQVTTVQPYNPPLGAFAAAVFPGHATIQGVIERVTPLLSGLVRVYINTSRQVPITIP